MSNAGESLRLKDSDVIDRLGQKGERKTGKELPLNAFHVVRRLALYGRPACRVDVFRAKTFYEALTQKSHFRLVE